MVLYPFSRTSRRTPHVPFMYTRMLMYRFELSAAKSTVYPRLSVEEKIIYHTFFVFYAHLLLHIASSSKYPDSHGSAESSGMFCDVRGDQQQFEPGRAGSEAPRHPSLTCTFFHSSSLNIE